jgi:hypothetical protein
MCGSMPEDGEGNGEGAVLRMCCGGGAEQGASGVMRRTGASGTRVWTEGIRPPLVFPFFLSLISSFFISLAPLCPVSASGSMYGVLALLLFRSLYFGTFFNCKRTFKMRRREYVISFIFYLYLMFYVYVKDSM